MKCRGYLRDSGGVSTAPIADPYAAACPTRTVLDRIGDRWTVLVLLLLAEQPVGTDGWVAVAWCVGLLVVAYLLAMATYRRATA